jgi:hypothetical protein
MSNPVADLKRELVGAAERRSAHHARRSRLIMATGALALAAVASLLVAAPWSSPPTFLERAEAALTPPADTILHMKWEVTSSATNPDCSITRGPNELWIDQEPPHRYRAILDDPPPAGASPHTLACMPGTRRELGGTVDPACSPTEQPTCTTQDTVEFEAPNRLNVSPFQFVLPPDPVVMLREAIRAGKAHHEGRTQLHGRTVERIRLDPISLGELDDVMASACAFPSCSFGTVYVDPETFHPVEVHGPRMVVLEPDDSGVVVPPKKLPELPSRVDAVRAQIDVVDRYLTFDYLPRTEENVALTDIRAQHPDATETDE